MSDQSFFPAFAPIRAPYLRTFVRSTTTSRSCQTSWQGAQSSYPRIRTSSGSALVATLWLLAAVAAVALTVIGAAWIGRPKSKALGIPSSVASASAAEGLDFDRVRANIAELSRASSRMTGYPGATSALNFVVSTLREADISDCQFLPFDAVVPMTDSATLTVQSAGGGISIPLHPLWPNMARTSKTGPDGISGPLVYVKSGSDPDTKGVQIRDAIVVMDWDSNTEWLGVPELGGRAVIFRANTRGTGNTARNKFLTVPANIPRFYVAESDLLALDALLQSGTPEAKVQCEMSWKRVSGSNILARICGSDSDPDAKEQTDTDKAAVVFHAYYDSVSVVPDLAPGAEQACGAATLLEVARFFTKLPRKPDRPIYVLFTGGHGTGLSGMTAFIRQLRNGTKNGWDDSEKASLIARMGRPALFVGLDLSSHSDRFGVFALGKFRNYWEWFLTAKFSPLGRKLDEYAKQQCPDYDPEKDLSFFVDGINPPQSRGWATYFPYQAAFESEMPTLAGFPGITFATINDDRRYVDTPDDTPAHMSFDLLKRQLLPEPRKRLCIPEFALALAFWKGPFVASEVADKWASLNGRVLWLDQERDYTPSQPLANALVFLKLHRGDKYLMGTRAMPVAQSDAKGMFNIEGLTDSTGSWEFLNCSIEAFGCAEPDFIRDNPAAMTMLERARLKSPSFSASCATDAKDCVPPAPISNPNAGTPHLEGGPAAAGPPQEQAGRITRDAPTPPASPPLIHDGSIIYAMDMTAGSGVAFPVMPGEQSVNVVTFPCKAITLFGLTDPRGYIPLRDLQMLEVATQSPPFQYGQSMTDHSYGAPEENCVTVWADPAIRIRLTAGLGFQEKRLALLNNSVEKPIGEGFVLGDLENIPSMILQGAGDMWKLDESRLRKFESHGINMPMARKIHEAARKCLVDAETALANRDYGTYRETSEKLWSLESKAYTDLLRMTNNMIRGVLFYLALLVPFSYIIERLLIAAGTVKGRIAGMLAIFAGSFTVLALVHPAFRFTLTPLVVLLAFIILVLALTVSLLLVGRFDALLQARKQAMVGVHEDSQNAGNVAARALDLGIANIRRRPQRGFLTALTIVLVTFTLLSFTSLVPEVGISTLKHPLGKPVYKGLLARQRNWSPLPTPAYDSLKRSLVKPESDATHRSALAGRAWFYSDNVGNLSQIDLALADTSVKAMQSRHFTSPVLLCLEPSERDITDVAKTLTAGRWFNDDNEQAIILPDHVAKFLGLGPDQLGAKVLVYGHELELVGITDPKLFGEVKDIDGEPLTPVDFVMQTQMSASQKMTQEEKTDTIEKYTHYAADQVAIVPLKFGRQLGAGVRSIAVRTGAAVDPAAEAADYTKRSNQTILASDGKDVTLFASIDTKSFAAAGQIGVPVLLGFIMVLGTMLGSVYERRREIFVYNSVGLSPTNVASLFLAESGVYAILGAGIGYLLGQLVSKVLLAGGMLSGLSLNYSAGTTVLTTIFTMIIVLCSTLYPARQAFLAAMPEKTDASPLETDDQTATDTATLYLPFVATPASIFAMQAYMYEYLDSVQGVTIGQLAVDDLKCGMETVAGKPVPVLIFRAWLAPFDLGVSHDVRLKIDYREDRNVYQYHMTATRYSGDQQNWRRLLPRFIVTMRKQLLMWRILSGESHQRYAERGQILFKV